MLTDDQYLIAARIVTMMTDASTLPARLLVRCLLAVLQGDGTVYDRLWSWRTAAVGGEIRKSIEEDLKRSFFPEVQVQEGTHRL